MQTLLLTLLAVFLTVYFGAKRKYFLSALSLAVMLVLFRPEMWLSVVVASAHDFL